MPLVTATFSTGGNVVIDDSAIEALITAQNTLLTTLSTELALITGYTKSAAGSHATSNNQQDTILTLLRNINVTLAQSALQTSTALAAIQSVLQQQVITQELIAADQIKNNLFQQTTVNTSRTDAGLTAIDPPNQALSSQITNGLRDAGTMQAQIAASAMAETLISNAAANAETAAASFISGSQTFFTPYITAINGSLLAVFGSPIAANTSALASKAALDTGVGVTSVPSK